MNINEYSLEYIQENINEKESNYRKLLFKTLSNVSVER